MRKFTFSFALICTVAAASFLGACSKNSDGKCSGDGACCKDKAASGSVKTDSMATPATGSGCSKSCTGEKKVCPATGATSN
jgi:hypothetical protein